MDVPLIFWSDSNLNLSFLLMISTEMIKKRELKISAQFEANAAPSIPIAGRLAFPKMKRIQLLTILFLIVFFHGALLYPEKLIAMINPEQAYIQKSASILRFIFGSIFMYGFFSVYFQTISGSGNTRWTLAVEIASVAVYILFAYLFIHVLLLDIYWVWSVEYIYFGTMGFVSYIYLKKSNWKKKII